MKQLNIALVNHFLIAYLENSYISVKSYLFIIVEFNKEGIHIMIFPLFYSFVNSSYF